MTSRRPRRASAWIAAVVAIVLVVLGGPDARGAAAPRAGWWSRTEPYVSQALATAVTGTDLVIGNDLAGPNAVAAVRIAADAPSGRALTLPLAGAQPVGVPQVVVCASAGEWTPVYVG